MFKDKGKIKRTNGFNRGSKRFSNGFNCISNERDRIDLIFFDNKEDKFIIIIIIIIRYAMHLKSDLL